MKWVPDIYTTNFTCPYCGSMVRDDGYGNCDYTYCPYCGQEVDTYRRPISITEGKTDQ